MDEPKVVYVREARLVQELLDRLPSDDAAGDRGDVAATVARLRSAGLPVAVHRSHVPGSGVSLLAGGFAVSDHAIIRCGGHCFLVGPEWVVGVDAAPASCQRAEGPSPQRRAHRYRIGTFTIWSGFVAAFFIVF